MSTYCAGDQITQVLLSWEGVTARAHRFGGTEYRLGRRELGHIHGDHMLDIPLPKKIWDEVVAAGQAEPHHLLSNSGSVSFYIRNIDDIERAIVLLRRSFELVLVQRAKRSSRRNQGDSYTLATRGGPSRDRT